ncbi:hypothetical protein AAG656_03230 [Streptomyces albidoflavus]|uniref:hypothetical protein n=1 Tax=Streptomyces albidoflavus TaxID=1886 RepID=UPI003159B086
MPEQTTRTNWRQPIHLGHAVPTGIALPGREDLSAQAVPPAAGVMYIRLISAVACAAVRRPPQAKTARGDHSAS